MLYIFKTFVSLISGHASYLPVSRQQQPSVPGVVTKSVVYSDDLWKLIILSQTPAASCVTGGEYSMCVLMF